MRYSTVPVAGLDMGSSARFYDPKPPGFQQPVDFRIDAVCRDGLSNGWSPRNVGATLDECPNVSCPGEESATDLVSGEVPSSDSLPEGAPREAVLRSTMGVDELVRSCAAVRGAHGIGKGPQSGGLDLPCLRKCQEHTGNRFVTRHGQASVFGVRP
jgi:hypothetical protein